MTEKKQLSGVLNLRVDDALPREIERIAGLNGTTASETARQLIRYGVEVERQVQASRCNSPTTGTSRKRRDAWSSTPHGRPIRGRELMEREDLTRRMSMWSRSRRSNEARQCPRPVPRRPRSSWVLAAYAAGLFVQAPPLADKLRTSRTSTGRLRCVRGQVERDRSGRWRHSVTVMKASSGGAGTGLRRLTQPS